MLVASAFLKRHVKICRTLQDAPKQAESDIESDGALLVSTPPPPVDTWGMHVKKKAPPPRPNEKNTATSPLAPKSPKGSSARSRRNGAAAAAEEAPPPPPPKEGTTPRGRTSSADRPPRGNTPKAAAGGGGAKKPPPPTRGLAKASSTSNKPGLNRGQDTSPTGSVSSVTSNKSSFRDTVSYNSQNSNSCSFESTDALCCVASFSYHYRFCLTASRAHMYTILCLLSLCSVPGGNAQPSCQRAGSSQALGEMSCRALDLKRFTVGQIHKHGSTILNFARASQYSATGIEACRSAKPNILVMRREQTTQASEEQERRTALCVALFINGTSRALQVL